MEAKAIALDPGVTSGYAMGMVEDGLMTVVSGQAEWRHIDLWQHLHWAKPTCIICERFEFRQNINSPRRGLELFPRELIGICNLYVQENSNCELILQQPMKGGIGKTPFSDQKLKRENLYKPGGHSNDATRHLLYWFTFGKGYQFNTRGYERGLG